MSCLLFLRAVFCVDNILRFHMQVASVHVIGKLLLPKVTAGGCNLAFKNAIFSMKNAPIFSPFLLQMSSEADIIILRVHF